MGKLKSAQDILRREELREEVTEKGLVRSTPIVIHSPVEYYANPKLGTTNTGTVLCVYQWLGVIYKKTSAYTDMETWSDPVKLNLGFTDYDDVTGLGDYLTPGRLIRVGSTLLLAFECQPPSPALTNVYVARSTDGGVTWAVVPVSATADYEFTMKIRWLYGNTVIAVYGRRPAANVDTGGIYCRISNDLGVTWGAEITIQASPGVTNHIYDEPDVVVVERQSEPAAVAPNPVLLCVYRDYNRSGASSTPNGYMDNGRIAESTDWGATWGASRVFSRNIEGGPRIEEIYPGGELIIFFRSQTFRWRGTVFSSSAIIRSSDKGVTWHGYEPVSAAPWGGGGGYGDLLQINDKLWAVHCPWSGFSGAANAPKITLFDLFQETLFNAEARLQGYRGLKVYRGGLETEEGRF